MVQKDSQWTYLVIINGNTIKLQISIIYLIKLGYDDIVANIKTECAKLSKSSLTNLRPLILGSVLYTLIVKNNIHVHNQITI